MNREIKFRAWDKEENKMVRVTLLDFPEWSISYQDGTDYYKNGDRNGFKNEDTDRCILMQYTGLKDKNGREIYEGDILRWVSSNPFSKGEIRTVKVYYTEAHFWCYGAIGVYLGELLINEKCEVIGNIYENPELIGQV